MTRIGSYHLAWTALALTAGVPAFVGCGMTRSTDSARTATEQLLISDAIDQAVQTVDFQPLAGQTVFLDDTRLDDVVDRNYLVSTLRQHLLASGCTLKNKRDEADFVVEARAGAIGTDRNDLLFGIPATNVPQILPLQGVPAAIPEVPLAKRRDQRGIAKISMFAYHRESGQPVWQSGLTVRESSSNDVWLFGAGPFQYGSVQQASERTAKTGKAGEKINLSQQAVFTSPAKLAQQFHCVPTPTDVVRTTHLAEPAKTAPLPFRAADGVVQPVLPGLAEAAIKNQVVPRLTGRIMQAELLRNAAPKTVEMSLPTRETDPIALPQPRFDSL